MLLTVLMLILWMQISQINGQEIKQNPQFLPLREGEDFTIYCNSSITLNSLQWYKQRPGGGPVLLITLLKGGEVKQDRLTARFGETRKDSSLHMEPSQTADAGTYFCAGPFPISGTNTLVFGTGTRLTVIPHVKEPDPAVYQLGGSKSNQISVCLFTDFDSETNVQEPQGPAVISLNSTVLDMKVMNSKSNAALAWGNSTDFKCNGTFNEKFFSSSDFSCDATLIAKNFETDMNLNFHNLIVIGLRILLLKVAGFNLFMTLRLWSR